MWAGRADPAGNNRSLALYYIVAPPARGTRARQLQVLFLFDSSLVADVKVRAFIDPGETFFCELFINCLLNGLVDQLIRHRAVRDVDPLVGFVAREVDASVLNILAVGGHDHE